MGGNKQPARRALVLVPSSARKKYGSSATKNNKVPIVEAVLARLKKAGMASDGSARRGGPRLGVHNAKS